MKNILDYSFPEDLKFMNIKELEMLAVQIREFLIENISKTGGHLASNLGAVELTLALHSYFDSPKDKIIWDVGHQSYVHKILTGRASEFPTLRQYKGLSGFPKRGESAHDIFDTGHSSNSISIAAGFAVSRDLKNEHYRVISVIGDGSMTGGLAFEGLNNLASLKSKAIVILNDNGMSIGKNTGGLSKHLSRIRVSKGYSNFKSGFGSILKKVPAVGESLYSGVVNIRDHIKYSLVDSVMFEQLGFTCIGPVDGHNIYELLEAFEMADSARDSVIIHVVTTKGKGYINAEKYPSRFHGTGAFDPATGNPVQADDGNSYSSIYGKKLVELARMDKRVVAISAAMIEGTGLKEFASHFPDRIFDVGIAEGHAVTFGGSLAINGMKPFITIYSTFLQRAYDNIIMDVCLQNAPVVFAIDRAGNVGADGETHHGMFDISYLKNIPNLSVFLPSTADELEKIMEWSLSAEKPIAIRYPRGSGYLSYDKCLEAFGLNNDMCCIDTDITEPAVLLKGKDVVIWSYGSMLASAAEATSELIKRGISVTLVDGRTATDICENTIITLTSDSSIFVTMEDGILNGGIGEKLNCILMENSITCKVINFGWPEKFIEHGKTTILMKKYGLDGMSVAERILKEIEK